MEGVSKLFVVGLIISLFMGIVEICNSHIVFTTQLIIIIILCTCWVVSGWVYIFMSLELYKKERRSGWEGTLLEKIFGIFALMVMAGFFGAGCWLTPLSDFKDKD